MGISRFRSSFGLASFGSIVAYAPANGSPPAGSTLSPLSLASISLNSTQVPGSFVAGITGKTPLSTVTMTGAAFSAGTLAVNAAGTSIVVGAAGPLPGGSFTGSFSLVETLAGATNTPRVSGVSASISVQNSNTAPTDIIVTWRSGFSGGVIPDGVAIDTVVADLSTTDANAGDTFTYAVESGDIRLKVVGATLAIADAIIYSAGNKSTTIRATDQGGLSYSEAIVWTIPAPAPINIWLSSDPSIPTTRQGVVTIVNGDVRVSNTVKDGFPRTMTEPLAIGFYSIRTLLRFDNATSYTMRLSNSIDGLQNQIVVHSLTRANDGPIVDRTDVFEVTSVNQRLFIGAIVPGNAGGYFTVLKETAITPLSIIEDASISSVDADGWQATYAAPPPSVVIDKSIAATGIAGFDGAGNPVSNRVLDSGFRVTRRLRNPGLTTLQANKVGLSLKVPAGAIIDGAVNNSAQVSPKPICNWISRHRRVIGNQDVVLEVVAGHYYAGLIPGEQVACVEFIISDGTTKITKKTSSMALSGESTDAKDVFCYRVTVAAAEIATLAQGMITYDCNVYPFIGTADSIARTSDRAARGFPTWKFARRYDIKDTVRAAAVPRCYISTTGTDGTGVWSTDDAAARAAPFRSVFGVTVAAQLANIPAGAFLPAASVDGCEVRAMAGTFNLAGGTRNVIQRGADIIFTRDPNVTRAQAIYRHLTAYRFRFGGGLLAEAEAGFIFVGATYFRNANVMTAVDIFSPTNMSFADTVVSMDNRSTAMAAASVIIWYWGGTTFLGAPSTQDSTFNTSAGGALGIIRGCAGNINGCRLQGYNTIGNNFTNIGELNPTYAVMNPDNATICYNINRGDVGTTYGFDTTDNTQTLTGILVMGNVTEWTSIVGNPVWRVSGDSNFASTNHILEYQNTYAGFDSLGRHNDRYVDTAVNAVRTHTWGRRVNNIHVQYNTKHDLFSPADPARIGGWEITFGVGNSANWTQFRDAGDGAFQPDYSSSNSSVSQVNGVWLNPFFKNNRAVLNTTTTGLGGGDYRLQRNSEGDANTSPCLEAAEWQLLPGFGSAVGAYP